jgi:hypothetical protein
MGAKQVIKIKELLKESDLGLTYKKGKTIVVVHKTSGKELVIVDKPAVRREYEKIGYVVEGSLDERMNFDEKQYVERIAGHFQTGIILQKMAQQMDKENRTDTEHKVLHMSLSKYLQMLKRNFKL